LSTKTDTVI